MERTQPAVQKENLSANIKILKSLQKPQAGHMDLPSDVAIMLIAILLHKFTKIANERHRQFQTYGERFELFCHFWI